MHAIGPGFLVPCKTGTDAAMGRTATLWTEVDVTAEHLPESDPRHHTRKLKATLDELVAHLREDVAKIDEPKAKVLFEVSAEVLSGLAKAYSDYEARTEAAFR
jgi:hypothetical protein